MHGSPFYLQVKARFHGSPAALSSQEVIWGDLSLRGSQLVYIRIPVLSVSLIRFPNLGFWHCKAMFALPPGAAETWSVLNVTLMFFNMLLDCLFPKACTHQNQQAATRSLYYSSVSLQSWINGAVQACEKSLEALLWHSCFWRGAKHGGQPKRKLLSSQPAESEVYQRTPERKRKMRGF